MVKNKIIYVITSTGNDFYSIMTRVSIASVRISNPDIAISLYCDNITHNCLISTNDEILKEVDETISIKVDDERPEFRNRFIKTQLRKYVKGKFIFMDSDILVRRDIKELFDLEVDIAAAMNHCADDITKATSQSDRDTFEKMNWVLPKTAYYNGGFIYYNDTELSHKFSDMWYNNWQLTSSYTAKYRDQPALNYSIENYGGKTMLLSTEYNAQIKAQINTFKNAKVWHYYSSQEVAEYFAFEKYINEIILLKKTFEKNTVEKLMQSSHPFYKDNFFTKRIIDKVQKSNKLNDKSKAILSGKRKLPF